MSGNAEKSRLNRQGMIYISEVSMEKYGVNELRKMFLEFFESKGHLAMKSFSLVPHNDKSLLLINAGMAPLKPYFTGAEIPPRKRVTTCQKCIRTGVGLPVAESFTATRIHCLVLPRTCSFALPELADASPRWNASPSENFSRRRFPSRFTDSEASSEPKASIRFSLPAAGSSAPCRPA